MRRKRNETRLAFAQMIALVCLAGCSGRKHADESADLPERIAECDAFTSAFQTCLARMGPGAQGLAADQGSLVTQATTSAQGTTAREALRIRCIEASKRITLACR